MVLRAELRSLHPQILGFNWFGQAVLIRLHPSASLAAIALLIPALA
jgi:hypothetical protein